MAHWLVKSEPETWSWDDHVKAGTEPWDGVRNHQAANNMKAMRVRDKALFYHSGDERRVVGIVEVVRTYYPDTTDSSGRFGRVDFKAVRPFKTLVSLADIKAEPRLRHLALVRQSRLSVSPVDDDAWALICKMGATAP